MISNHVNFTPKKAITGNCNNCNCSVMFTSAKKKHKADEFTPEPKQQNTEKKSSLAMMIAKFVGLITMILGLIGIHLTRMCEAKNVYQPNNDLIIPLRHKLQDVVQTRQIETSDKIKLNCWYVPPKKDKPTVLFCHGRFSNITLKQNLIEHVKERGMGIFLLEYRGYNGNEGTPSETGFYKDADAAVNYLNSIGTPKKDIVVWGHSLGGGVAAELGYKNKFKAVILESTFANIPDMIKHLSTSEFKDDKKGVQKMALMLAGMVPVTTGTILKSNFRTDRKVTKIDSPLLIVHSKKDKIVPSEMAEKIAANNPNAELYISKLGGHNKHNWGKEKILQFIENLSEDKKFKTFSQ